VDGGAYQVFLTEYDSHTALYVTDRTPAGFTVRSDRGAASGVFGYRVVAKRKDIPGPRLEKVTPPKPFEFKEPPGIRNQAAAPGRPT
jgi:hypothetical protein